MKRNFILAAGLVMTFICAQAVRAEMFSFSKSMSGTIADVRPDAISLTPTSPQAGANQIDLEINDSTKLKDIQAVTDLKQGDAIQVKYKEQDGRMIATQVEKDEEAAAAGASAGASAGVSAEAGAGSTTIQTETSIGGASDSNRPVEERLQVNQGTNQGASNKQDTITQHDGDSAYETQPNQGQPPHNLGSGDAVPSPVNADVSETSTTTTTTTTYPSGEVDASAPPAAEGQIRSTDPMPADGTPAMQR
jgi:hypothetical protein